MQKGWKAFSHLNGKSRKKTVSLSVQFIHDPNEWIYSNGSDSRSGESGSGDTGRYNHSATVTSGYFICGRIPEM